MLDKGVSDNDDLYADYNPDDDNGPLFADADDYNLDDDVFDDEDYSAENHYVRI
jgi:Tfp pilus assembly protein PilZ